MCTYGYCCTCDAVMITITVDTDVLDKEGGQGHAAAKVLHVCKEEVRATAGVKSVEFKAGACPAEHSAHSNTTTWPSVRLAMPRTPLHAPTSAAANAKHQV